MIWSRAWSSPPWLVILGAPTAALALYRPVLAQTDRGGGIGLLIMCEVIGLTGVIAVRACPFRPGACRFPM